jgi:ABC-type phosphate/phosphonate transport system substrate-binding protein
MARVASLGMYDAPGARAANDSLWQGIASRLTAAGVEGVPDTLDRSRSLDEIWADPDLLLAQTCGYPLVTQWKGKLQYLTTPRYRAPGTEGASHCSLIVVRKDDPGQTLNDFRGRTAAINGRGSNTGMNLPRALLAPLANGRAFFTEVIETGSHGGSAVAVAEGRADLAAIDAVTFAHLERDVPEVTAALRTLATTASCPSLPFVTSLTTPRRVVRLLRDAISQTIEDDREAAGSLFLDGAERIGIRRYQVLATMEARARRRGYPVLA